MIRALQPLLVAVFLSLLAKPASPQPVTVDGTARLAPITNEVGRQFQDLMNGSAEIDVKVSNTASGFKKFCRGELDINSSTRPILLVETELCKQARIEFHEVPIAYDVLTIIVNGQNHWATSITLAALHQLWTASGQNRVSQWHHLKPQWPRYAVRLFGSPPDSETFEFFSAALDSKTKALRHDVNQRGSSAEIIDAVRSKPLAIGYCPINECGKKIPGIKVLPVDFGRGPITASAATVQNDSYRTLSRPLFLYVNRKANDRVAVHQFVALYLLRASQIVSQVGYIPLAPRVYQVAVNLMKNRKVGSAYGGALPAEPPLDEFINNNAALR